MPRKLCAIRQFSLQYDTPPTSASTRRHSLKKQHSEELTNEEVGIRISLNTKPVPQHSIKIAWDDENSGNVTRPRCPPFRRHSHQSMGSTEKDTSTIRTNELSTTAAVHGESKTALYSRQDLAQKLHLAWQEKENTKNKLNIFLAHTTIPSVDIPKNNTSKELAGQKERTPRIEPKIMQPLLLPPDNASSTSPTNPSTNLKQIFQKHLRKSKMNSPVGSDCETISQAVVVVPIIERQKPINSQETSKPKREKIELSDEKISENVKVLSSRPQTAIGSTSSAVQKRAMYQKRTNSAFTSINSTCSSPMPFNAHQHQDPSVRQFRPPLIRASSLPTNKPDIQVKPRLRRKIKLAKRGKHPSKDHEDEKKSELVTMVSLVSASESEAEDLPEAKQVEENPPPQNVINNTSLKTSPNSPKKQADKHFLLRKTVKQVSFQHSSIHAVRSFSASFPARRASVGAALLIDSATKKLPKSLETREQTDERFTETKRRLLQCEPSTNGFTPKTILTTNKQDQVAPLTLMTTFQETSSYVDEKDEKQTATNKSNEAEHTESIKEKKCWATYCRMTKSGLNVSFDTILRGMLTPTEYRLRRRLSLEETQKTDKLDTSVDNKQTTANEK